MELEAKEDMEETVPGAEEAYGLETFLGGDFHEGFMARWQAGAGSVGIIRRFFTVLY